MSSGSAPVVLRLAVVLIGLVALLMPGPAVAASELHDDVTRDVHASRPGYEGPARRAPFADITDLRSTYRHKKLVLRTGFVELVSKPQHTLYVGIDVETSDGREFVGQLVYSSDYGISSIILLGDDRRPRSCFEKALRGRVNTRKATVSVIIPARCLGRPDWVRTGASSYVAKFEGEYREWRDDARAAYRKPDPGHVYTVPTYGPEIPRG